MDLDSLAEALIEIAHRATDHDKERWAKFGRDSLRDLYGKNWKKVHAEYMRRLREDTDRAA